MGIKIKNLKFNNNGDFKKKFKKAFEYCDLLSLKLNRYWFYFEK